MDCALTTMNPFITLRYVFFWKIDIIKNVLECFDNGAVKIHYIVLQLFVNYVELIEK